METSFANLFVLFVLTSYGANAGIYYLVDKAFHKDDYAKYKFVTNTILKLSYQTDDKEITLTTKVCERKHDIRESEVVTVAGIQLQLKGDKEPITLISFLLKELTGAQFMHHDYRNFDPLSSTLQFLEISKDKLEFLTSTSIEYGDDLYLYTITEFGTGQEKKIVSNKVEKSEVKDRKAKASMCLSKYTA